ncbi:MAG: biotin transporter BioY [Acidobacteriota bacterium]|jgi:biotin transport system substrate-specific component|nr:biotin transporter BioY [Acidobacteriota bacterium]
MEKPTAQALTQHRGIEISEQVAIVIGASLFVALCARIVLPLPFTPVPLTLGNFAVLLVGLTLGSRRGFAALALYLLEGSAGMPVFSPTGPGGLAQLLGPTGGFLLAYPFIAALAGWIMEHGKRTFFRAAASGLVAEILLFASGISWLYLLTHSLAQAVRFGLYWFVFAEIIKIMMAAAISAGWQSAHKSQE